MASRYPATFIGLEQQLGRIAPGYRADLLHINEALQPRQTWLAGESA